MGRDSLQNAKAVIRWHAESSLYLTNGPAGPEAIQEKGDIMKKTYKIDVDCAACAEKMETAARKTDGVKDATVSFMTLKMKVEFEDGADADSVMRNVRANCRKVEADCEVFI